MSTRDSNKQISLCSRDDCGDIAAVRGFCRKHYAAWYKKNRHSATFRAKARSREFHVPTSEIDLAYLAGLIDGEGCISQEGQHGYWKIQICMADSEATSWLAKMGGRHYRHLSRPPGRKDLFMWVLFRQNDVRRLLLALLPYLKLDRRKQKACTAIAQIERRGVRHYG